MKKNFCFSFVYFANFVHDRFVLKLEKYFFFVGEEHVIALGKIEGLEILYMSFESRTPVVHEVHNRMEES